MESTRANRQNHSNHKLDIIIRDNENETCVNRRRNLRTQKFDQERSREDFKFEDINIRHVERKKESGILKNCNWSHLQITQTISDPCTGKALEDTAILGPAQIPWEVEHV